MAYSNIARAPSYYTDRNDVTQTMIETLKGRRDGIGGSTEEMLDESLDEAVEEIEGVELVK